MPIVSEVKDDLFKHFQKKEFDIFVHGCNCFHSFGRGIAATVKLKYFLAYKADLSTKKGDINKLGTYSLYKSSDGLVVNMYTQYHYGIGKVNCNLDAIKKGFTLLNEEYKGSSVCIPRIGAGLAGGNWDEISKIINEVTPDLSIIVYYI